MNTHWEVADHLLKLSDIRRNLKFLAYLAPSPAVRAMSIVNKQEKPVVPPLQFMAFGFSIFALTNTGTQALGRFSVFEGAAVSLLIVALLLVYYWITFNIFSRYSRSGRTYEQFVDMCALLSGLAWSLQGAHLIASLFSEAGGHLLGGVLYIYLAVCQMQTWKRFWQLSYGKIILCSFLAAGAVCLAGLFLLVAVVGVAVPFA